MLLTTALGWAYVRYGALPTASWLLYGIKPVMLAVVLQAIWSLTPKAAKTTKLRLLGVLSAGLVASGANEIAVLFAMGLSVALTARRTRGAPDKHAAYPLASLLPAVATSATVFSAPTLSGLFWVFLKIGSVLFGSGYVLLAFLRADLVERLHWLSEAQLIDAIAVGQLTPGPVFTTATFVGYLLSGVSGALVATIGIFLPAFVFVALSGPWLPRLRASPGAAALLDGVNVASLALMAIVTLQLGRAALVDLPTIVLVLLSGLLLIRYQINSTWLVLGGAAAGWMMHALAPA